MPERDDPRRGSHASNALVKPPEQCFVSGGSEPLRDDRVSAPDFLGGGGEMGARMRGLDWSKTPLGPVQGWPQSLRSPLSMMLPSKAQIILFWGPEFVVFYNDAYRPVFGAKHPHALGKPGREAWSEIWESQLHGLLDGVVRTGEAFWAKDMLFLLERYGFLEETFFDVSYDPVRDESGRVGGVFCIVTETTGRVVGERRLALLKDLAAHNATARTPRAACVAAMETLAQQGADIPFAIAYLGETLQAATPNARAAAAIASPDHVREIPLTSAIGAGPWKLVVGINPKRPFDAQYQAFLDLVADQLSTAIANAQAYEDARQRAEALAELDRAKTAFFSNVSHEFRTPLTLMLGPVEELLSREQGVNRELLGTIQRNGQRLLKLVNTLLEFARIEAGRAQAAYAPIDLSALTEDLASNFRAACERAGLTLAVDCPSLQEQAWVDREMWEKIVLNLLSNAFKFTMEGRIDVQLAHTDDFWRLTVRDTGIGIPRASLGRIFDRFHRVEGARGRSHEGSGIGLALVQELVKLHGGTISVESTPGQGTQFLVAIPTGNGHLPRERLVTPRESVSVHVHADPYVAEALGWLPDANVAQPALQSRHAGRILVADDNADLRGYARRLLAEHYDVETVGDGLAALEAVRARRPNLIISDVMMPQLDGFGLIRELRKNSDLATIPVILLSARAGEEARLEGLHRGADDYLVKPFTARELLGRVAAMLQTDDIRSGALEALRQSREALREADRRKDEFLATLSHELRNPLAPLANGLHLLRLKGDDVTSIGPLREIMERQLHHLVRLVDDLLEMSRITRGTFELRRERVELATIVRNAVETSEPLVQAGHHRLEVRVPVEALWLDGDPVRLAQIFSNLLNNAAKYTDDGGTIVLAARRDGDRVHVSVRDTGCGIAPEALSRIFEMFSREKAQAGRSQGGLGIGLTLAKHLAEMHGGTIEARSDGPGRGSEFIVCLPLCAAMTETATSPQTAALAPMRILVVDDNRDAAASLAMVLRMLGSDVRIAHDGRAAIDLFGASDPAVVLLDIGMPGMDGYEVARALRARFPERHPAIVALTGWGQAEDRRKALEAGIDHHLIKPADIGALQELLATIASRPPGSQPAARTAIHPEQRDVRP